MEGKPEQGKNILKELRDFLVPLYIKTRVSMQILSFQNCTLGEQILQSFSSNYMTAVLVTSLTFTGT